MRQVAPLPRAAVRDRSERLQTERIVDSVERWFVGGIVALAVYVGFCALGIALSVVANPSLAFLMVAGWTVLFLSLGVAALVARALDTQRGRKTRAGRPADRYRSE
jgi:hypothetical protein